MDKNRTKHLVDPDWLIFAEEDKKIVDALVNQNEKLYRGICFHSQQYVEKILKGLLAAQNIRPPRIHDVYAINEICSVNKIKIPLSEEELQFLASVYIDVRYPPDAGLLPGGEPTDEHANFAFDIVKKLNKWINTL